MFRLQICLQITVCHFPLGKSLGWRFGRSVFSFIKFIPAPVSMRDLTLLPSFHRNTIDNNFPVMQLILGTFLLDSPLFGILEVGFFLSCRMENFESASQLCVRFVSI